MIPDSIMLHHSLTKDSETVSWSAIRRYHTEDMGWHDIGYHYGIELVGPYYEVLLGRMPTYYGAHCKQGGMNQRSLGICLVGNFDEKPPPLAQWNKAVEFVHSLLEIYNISIDRIFAHNQYATYKTCPGKMFSLAEFKEDVRRRKLSIS